MSDETLSKLRIDKSSSSGYRSSGKKPFYITVAAIVIVVIGLLARGVFMPAAVVEVATVGKSYPSQSFTLLNASGYIVAQRKAAVASKVTGRLIALSVEEGARVRKGDIIARLENEDVVALRRQAAANLEGARAQLEQARAERSDARINFERFTDLVGKGFVSKLDYDSAETRYKKANTAVEAAEAAIRSAEAALTGADVSLEYTLIRAPFNAVVLTKNADIGDIITPLGAAANAKAAVVTLADMDSLQVEVDVSESNLEKVRLGQPCEIQLDAFPESRFRGEVHMIVPTADRTKATVMIKVRFLDRDERILPEMSAKVAFLERQIKPEEMKPRTVISPASLMSHSSGKAVFLVQGDSVIMTPITTGERIGDMMEVLSGVKAGDRIVVKPSAGLKDRARIKIAEK